MAAIARVSTLFLFVVVLLSAPASLTTGSTQQRFRFSCRGVVANPTGPGRSKLKVRVAGGGRGYRAAWKCKRCPAGQYTLTLDGVQQGTATAGNNGKFTARFRVPPSAGPPNPSRGNSAVAEDSSIPFDVGCNLR